MNKKNDEDDKKLYILPTTIFVLIVFFFWDSIISILNTYILNPNPIFQLGSTWFLSLLFINVIMIFFIIIFYYNKSSQVGIKGIDGDRGFPGQEGEPCKFRDDPPLHYTE
jgi:hypothetical protein